MTGILDEFRDGAIASRLIHHIHRVTTGRWRIMEVCGGQTHSIIRHGIDQLLPDSIELIHGPGCPVCVTPIETVDRAIRIASLSDVTFCTFGDMLRVPGSNGDLSSVKAAGGDVRIVYSPLDAVEIAKRNPSRRVVFFAIGFETTAPANAMAVFQAKRSGVSNFSVLVSHVLVPPAMKAVLDSPGSRVQAFLAAGHVCTVMGTRQYESIAKGHQVPIVITGFEPIDVLDGIRLAIEQLESGTHLVQNAYPRVVQEQGNRNAQALMDKVFVTCERNWRGIGAIPESGWRLHTDYADFDAEILFDFDDVKSDAVTGCRAGEVLQGKIKPDQCEAFGKRCTPRTPLGATMVSGEGACAAYYQSGRFVQIE